MACGNADEQQKGVKTPGKLKIKDGFRINVLKL